MTEEEYQYMNKVYEFLITMPPGKEYLVDNLCRKETRVLFVETVKSFIIATTSQGSHGIEFSEDYEKIRKIDF